MGTRGHLYIRCRGRWFIYYNQLDSYPEGLGEAIVAQIPADSEEYRKWLESMRAIFSRLIQRFEDHHLPVTAVVGEDDVDISREELYAKSFLALDDRLSKPPTLTMSTDHMNDLYIEFTYTVDLDQEIFSVDDAAHFQLSKLPHHKDWVQYVDQDSKGRRVLRPDTPKGLSADAKWQPDIEGKARTFPDGFNIKTVIPKASIDSTSTLLVVVFECTKTTYRELLDRYILTWKPSNFSFREMAFALLSLAAGDVSFECPRVLDRRNREDGYYLIPDAKLQPHQQKFLPAFLEESHTPGVEPGSAPKDTTFWFNGALVYLTSRLDLIEVEEASVVEVVEAGLSQGLKYFNAIVFSILDYVLVRVKVEEDGTVSIKRSPLMPLLYFDDENSHYADGPRTSSKSFLAAGETGAEYISFFALMHFFKAAANQSLIGTKSSILPNEVLGMIMQFSDTHTYHTLATVSSYCRKMAYTRFRLNDHYAVSTKEDSGGFVLEDQITGDKIESALTPHDHDTLGFGQHFPEDELILNPIIGIADVKRNSIMSLITVSFSNVASKDPLFTKKSKSPREHRARYFWSSDPRDNDPKRVLSIKDYEYSGSVEENWGRFVNQTLKGTKSFVMPINGSSYQCLLPPGYRELRSDGIYFRNPLRAILRCARDESPKEWEMSLKYAVRELAHVEATGYHRREPQLQARGCFGCFVIVAFGTRYKLFYYVHHTPNPPPFSPATNNSYSEQIAASVTDPDPEHRLIQLIPGEEPLDLHDSDSWAKLENWLGVVRGSYFEKRVVYDPIDAEYVAVPENES